MLIKILVVDDSASDRMIIKKMLGDYSILIASDGIEAMRQLNEHPDINLLILDLNMPNMDGFAVLEALNSNEKYKKLRTIILTNYDEIDNEIKGLKLGAVDYIRKPIHMDSLRARIDIHVELINIQYIIEQKLYEQSTTFDTILNQAPIGISISYNQKPLGSNSKVVPSFNAMFEQITGRSKHELIELGWEIITHPDDLEQDVNNFNMLHQGEIDSYSMDKRFIKPDGSTVWVHMVVAPIVLSNGQKNNHICLIQDISKRKEMENNLRYIYEHDILTGLYNREYLNFTLENDAKQIQASKRALVGINLSTVQLLTINYGYNYTQSLMLKVVDTLTQYCTDDNMFFRTHENRFVFYIKNYNNKNELIDFAESVATTLESFFAGYRVGGGIGILEIQQDESNPDMLTRKLLIASEKAISVFDKEFRACFYDETLEASVNRESEIRQELSKISNDKNNDNLFVQYQPIFDLKTNSICSFEALARLRTDKLGLVSPIEFIPIAEETKLIIPIGEKVFINAFNFLNKLKTLGYNSISVSVNVSAIQLLRPDFTSKLLELIKKMHVNTENICIEITESIFAYDYSLINKIIGQLKNNGLYIAIDDFGTGYSSLARENELNVNCLKIDKFFIDKLTESAQDKTITGDIISIAHRLGHCTIAEGVENEEQIQYLITHGCDKIQGYLISRPIDEQAAIELLKNQPDTENNFLLNDRQSTVMDSTEELQKTVINLGEYKEQLQLILNSTAEAIYGIDANGNCTFCNMSCIKMLGYKDQSDLLGKNMHWQIHHTRRDGTHLPIEECKILNAYKQGKGIHFNDEVFWRADGTFFDVEYHSYPQVKNGKIIGAVVTFMDISEQKKKEEEIQYLIYHDVLTGLYNRRYFQENISKIDSPDNLPLSVIFADINALKITNDIFGHSAGDELIKKSSEILQSVCRKNDVVTRIGGDEFIILLPNTAKKNAENIIERIKFGFTDARVEAIKCSISLGMDTKQNPDESLDVIMTNAENMMYKEKTMNRKSLNKDIIETIIETLHSRSPREKQHSITVSELCSDVGNVLHIPEAEKSKLMRAGYLHDIGKIVLNKNILSKDELTDEEREKMRQHSVIGYRILNLFDDTLDLAEVVYGHHELWDGTGYPRGLKGEEIPLLSRIITVVETYDHIFNRSKLSLRNRKQAALDVVKKGAGTKFDPEIAELFVNMMGYVKI